MIFQRVMNFPGQVGFYFEDLQTGQVRERNATMPLQAASVIKLPVMVEFYRQVEQGMIAPQEMISLRREDKLPSCGSLSYMHDGLNVTWEDLCTLMIIQSDNTATNLLIRRLGAEQINETMQKIGTKATKINRLLFDSEAASRGLENTVSAADMALLLGLLYRQVLVSPKASAQMQTLLTRQRLNGKIPFFLHSYTNLTIAHKTGEDTGITHDVALILGEHPFLLLFLGNGVDVPLYERVMQDTAWETTKNIYKL